MKTQLLEQLKVHQQYGSGNQININVRQSQTINSVRGPQTGLQNIVGRIDAAAGINNPMTQYLDNGLGSDLPH